MSTRNRRPLVRQTDMHYDFDGMIVYGHANYSDRLGSTRLP